MKHHFSARLFPSLYHQSDRICFFSRVFASLLSTKTSTLQSSSYPPPNYFELQDRIESVRDPKASVVAVLDHWVGEGNTVEKHRLQSLVRFLKGIRRFNHALEVSLWMTDRRYLMLSASDAAVRLDLIHRVYGLERAENYFAQLSDKVKNRGAYGALLSCYVQEGDVQNAEATMWKMRAKGMASSSFPYNMMINLYSQTWDFDKIDALMLEMEREGIPKDKYTMSNLLAAFAAASKITEMERILNLIEENPDLRFDYKIYATAANGYIKVGSLDKALTMLKKMEEMLPLNRRNLLAVNYLVTLYASIGNKDEVYRVWNTYKSSEMTDSSYSCMIESLAKLDDVEGAEKIFEEWESRCTFYDFRILNRLISAYCRKGFLEKAESAVEKAMKVKKPYASTWNLLAVWYKEHNQMSKAVEMLKSALLLGRGGWKPSPEVVDACLNYLEAQGDAEGMEELVKLLNNAVLPSDMYQRLSRTYNAAGKFAEVSDQSKLKGYSGGEPPNTFQTTRPSL